MKKSIIFASLLLCQTGFTAQILDLDSYTRHSVVVSVDELNRIAVENDKIHQVYGDEGRYVVQGDEVGGQVFLKVLVRPDSEKQTPFTVTVITQSGQAQDLLLTPKAGSARTIILRPKVAVSNIARTLSRDEQIIALIKAMCEGKNMVGFKINHNFVLEKKLGSLVWKARSQYVSEHISEPLEGLVLEVSNGGHKPITLLPEWFRDENVLAVAILDDRLAPQGITKVLLARKL